MRWCKLIFNFWLNIHGISLWTWGNVRYCVCIEGTRKPCGNRAVDWCSSCSSEQTAGFVLPQPDDVLTAASLVTSRDDTCQRSAWWAHYRLMTFYLVSFPRLTSEWAAAWALCCDKFTSSHSGGYPTPSLSYHNKIKPAVLISVTFLRNVSAQKKRHKLGPVQIVSVEMKIKVRQYWEMVEVREDLLGHIDFWGRLMSPDRWWLAEPFQLNNKKNR